MVITTKFDKDDWYKQTPREEIDRCLNCTRSKCTDCIGREPVLKKNKRPYKVIDAEEFINLYNSGENVLTMAEKLGVDRRLLWRRLELLKAEYRPGQTRRVLTIADIECLPEWMQRHFVLKGEPMA